MKAARRRIDVDLNELDQVLDGARQAPLSETDYEKLKSALHALAAMLVPSRNTEKTSAVLEKSAGSETGAGTQPDSKMPPPPGHGRNGAEAFGGAQKVEVAHRTLTHGDRCPECGKGNVYGQKEPKVMVRIIGQAPLAATVYSLERLRCGACGQVFTAQEPEGVGAEKYDGGGDDRATQVWQRHAILPAGTTGRSTRHSTAGGDTVGDRGRSCGVDQTGSR